MSIAIDLAQLPAPNVVEALSFERINAEIQADLVARMPELAEVLQLESEPLTKLIEACSYREMLLRARINDAARSVMLAYAIGVDLDHLGAAIAVARLDHEADDRFRQRIQQGFHRLAAAGPANAYRQHALAVSAEIADVSVWSAAAGQVTVVILARASCPTSELTDADIATGLYLFGAAPDATNSYAIAPTNGSILRAVLTALNTEDVRPLTDHVIVRAPTVQSFAIDATLEILPGPDSDMIRIRRQQAVHAYLASVRRLDYDVTRAGLIAALVEPGVKNVQLRLPIADIVCDKGEIAVCTGIAISAETVNA